MNILVLTQYYPPERAGIVHSVATGLSERGHNVKVLTGFPNYPEGKIFSGYSQKWRQREQDGGIELLRVPLFPDHSSRVHRRVLNYVTFALTSASAWHFAKQFDVIYVYATQMTPALGPWLWRFLGGAPFVLHVQDLWPDSITGSSLVSRGRSSSLVQRLLNPWLRSIYRRAGGVVGIAPTMVATLQDRGVPSERSHLVYNWASRDPEILGSPVSMCETQHKKKFLVAGNIGDMQDIETIIRVAAATRMMGAQFIIVGDGTALTRVKELAERLCANNVTFVGRIPAEEMAKYYAEADYAMVTLKDLPAFRGTIPSRFQVAISYGVPIITNVPGDLSKIVKAFDLGLTAEVESVDSLRDAVVEAIRLGDEGVARFTGNALRAYAEHFKLDRGIDAIEEILTSVVNDFSQER